MVRRARAASTTKPVNSWDGAWTWIRIGHRGAEAAEGGDDVPSSSPAAVVLDRRFALEN
jgi:hypothetical protein